MKAIAILFIVLALTSARSYPLFKQCDSQWGSTIIGSGPETICKVGCLLSSVSMALNSYGKTVDGQSSNPKTVNDWLKAHSGYSGELFIWGSISSLGFSYVGKVNAAQAATDLDQGYVVILNVRNGGHWVLATGRNGSTFNVNDPGYNVSTYTQSEVTQAAIFSVRAGFLQQAYEAFENLANFVNQDD
ncbi:hypothetical protein ABPG72_005854 [Tetrahymena utriculariae]